MNNIVSIIVPVYNAQEYIERCLDSILANDFTDFEIIAINDGSSDRSLSILNEYAKKYPEKIRVYDQVNQGVAKTRNAGITHATGKYVMFVDNDDYIEKDYLEKFVDEIDKNALEMVIGGYRRTTGKDCLFEMRLSDSEWSKYMIMAPWSKIYSREFLLKKEIKFLDNNIGEDVYFNLQAINLTDRISIMDYCGYNWFYNEQSVSNSKQKNIKNKMNVMFLLESSYAQLKKMGVTDKKVVEFYFIRYIIWYLLFIGRKSDYKEIYSEYFVLFKWLGDKFGDYRKNEYVGLNLPHGETLKNKIIVYVFISIHRIGLMRMFLWLYSR